jgi:hypothetical protein
VPDAAEIHPLVLELDHRCHEGAFRKPFQLGILHRFAECARELDQRLGRERLLAHENHQVIEPRLPDLGHDLCRERTRRIDPQDFRAEGARNGTDFDFRVAARHHWIMS